eukprot:m.1485440 g.1485440  ORF g.1485440 m.1485440 type:complete len:741 (+) comp25182_c0_seq6:1935-4157(+)
MHGSPAPAKPRASKPAKQSGRSRATTATTKAKPSAKALPTTAKVSGKGRNDAKLQRQPGPHARGKRRASDADADPRGGKKRASVGERAGDVTPAPAIALEHVQGLHKTRRSGRTVVPPLAFWKGQRLVEDRGARQVLLQPGSSDRTALSAERYAVHRTDEEDFLLQSPSMFASDCPRRRIRPAAPPTALPRNSDGHGDDGASEEEHGREASDPDDGDTHDIIDDMLNDAAASAHAVDEGRTDDGRTSESVLSPSDASDVSEDVDTVLPTPRRAGGFSNASLVSSPSSSESSPSASDEPTNEVDEKRHSPVSEYEARRALNIARNSQVLVQLGLKATPATDSVHAAAAAPTLSAGGGVSGANLAAVAAPATGKTRAPESGPPTAAADATDSAAAPGEGSDPAGAGPADEGNARVLRRRTTRAPSRPAPDTATASAPKRNPAPAPSASPSPPSPPQPPTAVPAPRRSDDDNSDVSDGDDSNGDDDDPWTLGERRRLAHAVRQATRGGGELMWDTVARALGTGRTAAQCCAQYMGGAASVDKAKASAAATSSARGHAASAADASRAATPVLRARPGTLKGKQQMRAILDHEDAGHVDDFFTSTPMRNQRQSVRLADRAIKRKIPAIMRAAPNAVSAETDESPAGTRQDQLGPNGTPGTADTPGLLRKHVRRTDIDAYVGRTLNAKRKGVAAARMNTKKTNSSAAARDAAGELRKALTAGPDAPHSPGGDDDDDEEEEDYYFSD